jgi:Spy/CpxP family protein refolding chaperone
MRIICFFLPALLLLPLTLVAQAPPAAGDPASPPHAEYGARRPEPPPPPRFDGPREMGKWWKNSSLAQKLNLRDDQIKQLDSVFFEHRLKLIDDQAELEKQDLRLQALLDEDTPNEAQVGAQVDQALGAKSKLEREFTMMNLALRRVLSVEQWRQLKALREDRHDSQGRHGGPRDGGGPGPGPIGRPM